MAKKSGKVRKGQARPADRRQHPEVARPRAESRHAAPAAAEPATAEAPAIPAETVAEVSETSDSRPAAAAAPAPEPEVPAGGKAKAPKRRQAAARPQGNKLSALDAAAKVLAEEGRAMSCPELIAAMAARGYWSSPNGKTPAATLYAAIAREIQTKAAAARFTRSEPGKFARAARA
jgi:hypothetical protein